MSEKRTYIVECVDRDGNLRRLIEYLGQHGNSGHSFSIVVDPDMSEADGGNKRFGWDGDGSDRIISVKEKQIAQDGKMKRLKEIVGLLQQIVPLVTGGQDGGPGSGVKGHTTAEAQNTNSIIEEYNRVSDAANTAFHAAKEAGKNANKSPEHKKKFQELKKKAMELNSQADALHAKYESLNK